MTPLPPGFWVGVEGTDVFLKVPTGARGGVHILSANAAETLADLLRSASALASRQELLGFDVDEMRAAIDRAMAEAGAVSSEAGAVAAGDESARPDQRSYEIRDRRESKEGRPSIELWLPGWYRPAVRAVEVGEPHAGAVGRDAADWMVRVDPKVAEVAGLGFRYLAGVEVFAAEHAMGWVELLAGLYVKAVAR